MKIRVCPWLACAAATVLAAAAAYAGRDRWLPSLAAWLDVGMPPQRADAVFLLTGGENTRPFAVAALIEGRWARQAVFCSSRPPAENELLSGHEIIRRVLRQCGIAEHDITILDREVRTTYDEALALRDFVEASPQARVLLLTDGPHTRRARWLAEWLLGDDARRVVVVSVPVDDVPVDAWWRSRAGFEFVLSEYLKLAFYAVRYGRLGHYLVAAGGLATVCWLILRHCRRRREAQVPNRQALTHLSPRQGKPL